MSHPDAPGVEVDVFDVETDEFTEAQTGVSEQGHNVALRAARYGESRYLSGRQVGVCGLPHGWELGPIGGIFAADHPGVGGVFEAHPQRRMRPSDRARAQAV